MWQYDQYANILNDFNGDMCQSEVWEDSWMLSFNRLHHAGHFLNQKQANRKNLSWSPEQCTGALGASRHAESKATLLWFCGFQACNTKENGVVCWFVDPCEPEFANGSTGSVEICRGFAQPCPKWSSVLQDSPSWFAIASAVHLCKPMVFHFDQSLYPLLVPGHSTTWRFLVDLVGLLTFVQFL